MRSPNISGRTRNKKSAAGFRRREPPRRELLSWRPSIVSVPHVCMNRMSFDLIQLFRSPWEKLTKCGKLASSFCCVACLTESNHESFLLQYYYHGINRWLWSGIDDRVMHPTETRGWAGHGPCYLILLRRRARNVHLLLFNIDPKMRIV